MNHPNIDISTQIASVSLPSCIYNASGCKCTTYDELESLSKSKSGAILTKSSTMEMRKGNAEPRLYYDNLGSINSMGIPNFGYKFYHEYRDNFNSNKPYIQSVFPFSKEEMGTMLQLLNSGNKKYLVELNLSCPNILGKSLISYDYVQFEEYIKYIDNMHLKNLEIGIKLPPYYEDYQIEQIANILLKYKRVIRFIVCINSVIKGLIIDSDKERPVIKNVVGGIGGIYCKPVALSNVYRFHKLLKNKIQIVGCGSISSGKDIFDYILCGASAIQVGTQLMNEGLNTFERLEKELKEIMAKKGYQKLSDFMGKIKD